MQRRSVVNILLPWFLLVLIGLAQAAHSGIWLRDNGFLVRPPTTEDALRRLHAEQMRRKLLDAGPVRWITAAYDYRHTHAPLMIMAAAGVAIWRDTLVTPEVIWLTELLFGLVLTLGAYHLARNFGDPWFSVVVAAVTQLCTITIISHRGFYPQFPMTALAVLALDALVRTRAFERTAWSVVFGALAGLAAMTKTVAPLYLVGAALVAALIGLRAKRPVRGLVNLVTAGAVAAAIFVPWLVGSWDLVVAYEAEVTSQDNPIAYEHAELWSPERWLYYPLNVVNNGLGLPLATLVVAGLVAWLVRGRRFAVAAGALPARAHPSAVLILVAGWLASYVILTLNKPTDQSHYAVSWMPLLAMIPVAAVWRLQTPRARALASVVLLGAGVWNLVLTQRPMYEDETTVTWGPLEIVPQTDWFLTGIPRYLRVEADDDAEDWHVAELTQTMLQRFPDGSPTMVTLHPILNVSNVRFEAIALGRDVVPLVIPWQEILAGKADPEFLLDVDFTISNSQVLDAGQLADLLRAGGLGCDIVAEHQVTPVSKVSLLHLTKPWEKNATADDGVLAGGDVKELDLAFANGWSLRGVRIRRPKVLGERGVLETLWTAAANAPASRMVVRRPDLDESWRGRRRLNPGEQGSRLLVVSVVVPSVDQSLALWVSLRGEGGRVPIGDGEVTEAKVWP